MQARGGEAQSANDWRTYAAGLAVPEDYSGPKYEGPGSIDDAFVEGLLSMYKEQGKLPMKYAYLMAADTLDLLKAEKSLQHVPVPEASTITVVGDIHGQFFDFVHMLEQVSGRPSPQNPILFNGDFVDRGPWSVEVLLCLYAFKLQHPSSVHFNRGNHETEMTTSRYGFEGEVEVKYEKKMMELFSETFRYLPLATVLENQVFVIHGGLPGPEEPTRLYLIRSHEVKAAGHQETIKNVYTVFSGPNYKDNVGNLAAIAVLTNRGGLLEKEKKFIQFKHQPHPDVPSGAYIPGNALAPSR